MRITEEERQEIKDEFLFNNEIVVAKYAELILNYWKSKTLESDKNIVNAIFQNYDKVEKNIRKHSVHIGNYGRWIQASTIYWRNDFRSNGSK